MRQRLILVLLVLAGLVYGITTFVLPSLAGGKAQAATKTAPGNDAGYQVGDRLPAVPPKPGGTSTVPTAFEEVTWFALIPKDWEPMKMFDESMAKLNDADPRAMDAL